MLGIFLICHINPSKIKLIEIILIAPIKYSLELPALNNVAKELGNISVIKFKDHQYARVHQSIFDSIFYPLLLPIP